MKPSKVELIYYSPTGTSKKVLEGVAKGLGVKDVEQIDLTPYEAATKSYSVSTGNLAVIAVPVYGGRVPIVAAQRLKTVKGNDTPAVIVTLYGNRAFEDALIELKDIATEQGFKPLAGAAFIGEHSFSTDATPIAVGRPDKEDLVKAETFGEKVKAKVEGMEKPVEVKVPGNKPYRERNPIPKSPETTPETCNLCGACAEVCPTNAITVTDKVETVKENCSACSACVKACPTGARVWKNEMVKKASLMLVTNYSKRRESEFFL
ncbi:MAG: 4Fe-4S binding protein [Candidatus Bathyarchaeia archaeon]|jgi:ferredoxin